MTLKQAIKQTLKKHETKVNNYLEGTDEEVCDCGFCAYAGSYLVDGEVVINCHICPTYKLNDKPCYMPSVFPDGIIDEYIHDDDNDDKLCNVLARMMHLHVFEEEYNAVMKERGESN